MLEDLCNFDSLKDVFANELKYANKKERQTRLGIQTYAPWRTKKLALTHQLVRFGE